LPIQLNGFGWYVPTLLKLSQTKFYRHYLG